MIKSRRLRWAGHVARMEEGRSAFKNLIGKSTGKRLLRRPRRRWEDNIRMDLEEIIYRDLEKWMKGIFHKPSSHWCHLIPLVML